MSETIHLVDANGLLHRFYHGSKKDGASDSAALVGVLEWFGKLIDEAGAKYICAVLDGRRNWRREKYPQYKAHRTSAEPELTSQLGLLGETLAKAGFLVLSNDDNEADDVIAALVERFAAEHEIIIHTGDKDMAQLVSDTVFICDPFTKLLLDPAGVKARFGVWPSRMADYLALMGDAADNVPGVPKFGKVTAAEAVAASENAEDMLERAYHRTLGSVPQSKCEVLWELRSVFRLSRELVDLNRGVTIQVDLEAMRWASKAVEREAGAEG